MKLLTTKKLYTIECVSEYKEFLERDSLFDEDTLVRKFVLFDEDNCLTTSHNLDDIKHSASELTRKSDNQSKYKASEIEIHQDEHNIYIKIIDKEL